MPDHRRPAIRLFVSSTFSDFKNEREALQRTVFPAIERICARRQFQFQAVDLRWGISTEASLDHRAMRICLEELRRSQDTSIRPSLLVLLGNRYGWRPLPEEISSEEFQSLAAAAPSDTSRDIVATWYVRDDNAVPATYVLRSRRQGGDRVGRDADLWEGVQAALWQTINLAFPASALPGRFAQSPGPEDTTPAIVRFQTSATEQEIWRGLFMGRCRGEDVVAVFREIDNTGEFPSLVDIRDFVDVDSAGALDLGAQASLCALKQVLRDKLPSTSLFEIRGARVDARRSKVDLAASDYLELVCSGVRNKLAAMRGTKAQTSPNGKWLRSARPPAVPVGSPLVATLRGPTAFLNRVFFSPNARLLATLEPSAVRLWEAETGTRIATLEGKNACIAFSGDRCRVASVEGNEIRIRDGETGAATTVLRGHAREVDAIWFSPNGRRLISHSWHDGTIRLWNVGDAVALRVLSGQKWELEHVAFSTDGRRVAFQDRSGSWLFDRKDLITVWDAEEGTDVSSVPGSLSSAIFSGDGKYMAFLEAYEFLSAPGRIRLVDLERSVEGPPLASEGFNLSHVALSPDGKHVMAAGRNDHLDNIFGPKRFPLIIWAMPNAALQQPRWGHKAQITSLRSHPTDAGSRQARRTVAHDCGESTATVVNSYSVGTPPPSRLWCSLRLGSCWQLAQGISFMFGASQAGASRHCCTATRGRSRTCYFRLMKLAL